MNKVAEFAKAVATTPQLSQSAAFLVKHRADLGQFDDVEDFAMAVEELGNGNLKGIEFHLMRLRQAMATSLWKEQIFIGVSILDSLLFQAFQNCTIVDPIGRVLEFIEAKGLHKAGFVVYPVHSTGFLGGGFLKLLKKATPELFIEDFGLLLQPATGSEEKTIAVLRAAAQDFEIPKEVPVDLVKHWMRSRPTEWLTQNPLLILKVKSRPGGYYENQYFLTAKLQFATSLIYLLTALQSPNAVDDFARFGSSSIVNNFATLDIYHYLVFYRKNSSKLGGQCVPMNVSKPHLAELCNLTVEIDPRGWSRRGRQLKRIVELMRLVESGYFAVAGTGRSGDVKSRVFHKLFDSLKYFRRSFRKSEEKDGCVVNLAIAFEALLTDNYCRGVDKTIQERVRTCVRGIKGSLSLRRAVRNLYVARSETVHSGWSTVNIDLEVARRAFAQCFLAVADRLKYLPATSSQPIADILGR